MRGKFITIEGMDGVGKSTHSMRIVEYLESKNLQVVKTFEPGGTDFANLIRDIVKDNKNCGINKYTELFLFLASRAEHTEKVILPNLEAGKIVVCDRYVDSTIAYQGYGHGLDITLLKKLNQCASFGVAVDLTILLTLNSQKASFLRKCGHDSTDRMENYDEQFYDRVYRGFESLSNEFNDRIVPVEASGSVEQTQEAIIKHIDKIINM